MRLDDVARIRVGSFVRPATESATGLPHIEDVLAYVARTDAGVLLLDTGIGEADAETEAWYRPQRIGVEAGLRSLGLTVDEIDLVVNCHLHFDHIGGNPLFAGTPIHCQRQELQTAQSTDYTVAELVDFLGARYELLDGESQLAPGVHVIPTPGHVAGHQSVVLECEDGSVVLAGQAHDTSAAWSSEVLVAQASTLGHGGPLPPVSPWVRRLLEFDPKQVFFAHDSSVWMP